MRSDLGVRCLRATAVPDLVEAQVDLRIRGLPVPQPFCSDVLAVHGLLSRDAGVSVVRRAASLHAVVPDF